MCFFPGSLATDMYAFSQVPMALCLYCKSQMILQNFKESLAEKNFSRPMKKIQQYMIAKYSI